MAKTKIRGTFATGADAATVHQISNARRNWLDRETAKAVDEAVTLFIPLGARSTAAKKTTVREPKRVATSRSQKVLRLAAKKK